MASPDLRLTLEVDGELAYEFGRDPLGVYSSRPHAALERVTVGGAQVLALTLRHLLQCVGAKELRQALTAAEAASKPQENTSA
jgi:hypothetical protein